MFHCKNGYEFSETESRGKNFKYGLPFLVCPFCGDEVPLAKMKDIMQSLQDHEQRMDELVEKLEVKVVDLEKKLSEKEKG